MNIKEMFEETTIWKSGRNSERRRFYRGKYWYRVLWDLMHPDQPCKNFVIHHIDFNELNDDISNLVRLTRAEHNKIHKTGKIFSEEHKQKMSQNHFDNSGSNHPSAIAVNINGKIFSTGREAARYLNVDPATIRNRILSKNFPGYSYAS